MDLVSQRPHAPGAVEPRSFEDALRELLHDSPFFVLSVVLHALLLLVFAMAPPQLSDDPQRVLIASPEPPPEVPPPDPLPPPTEIEQPTELLEDPRIVELPMTPSETLMAEGSAEMVGPVDDGRPSELGVGSGPPSGYGGLPGGKYGERGGDVSPPVNASVHAALDWLARHQDASGAWSCAGFDTRCADAPACDGTGSPEFDVGVTGLALLAFLGAGETAQRGEFRDTVRRGLKFLSDAQGPDGNFGNPRLSRHTYDHTIATLAMVEAYELSGKARIYLKPAEKGLRHLYDIRNPGGAWRYADFHPDMQLAPNDVSVTGWAILAMTSARDVGLSFDAVALEDALLFLDEMTDPETGATGYTERGGRPARMEGLMAQRWPADQSESMTAVAVLCRIFADPDLRRPGAREAVEKGVQLISRVKPLWSDGQPGRRDYYSWYYGSYALYQVGDKAWRDWEVTIVPEIAKHQIAAGDARGSWDPQHDPWGGEGGRVYSTAMLALTMEVYSRYAVLRAH